MPEVVRIALRPPGLVLLIVSAGCLVLRRNGKGPLILDPRRHRSP